MIHVITELDKQTLRQSVLNYHYRIYLTNDDGLTLDELNYIQSIGSISINSESDVRRSTSLTIFLTHTFMDIERRISSWMCLNFVLQIGIENIRTDSIIWYDMGTFVITDAQTSFDAVSNSLTLNLSDWFVKFNGTRNGQIGGAPIITIPTVDESGNKNTLKSQLVSVIRNETDVSNYIIEDIGEFYGMAQNNPNWSEYRTLNPDWDKIPYDYEFSAGCSVADIINQITGTYPNIQKYFDIYNNFCCNMIPSCENNQIVLNDEFIQSILISDSSESVTYNIQDIKNITEVFGANYEVNRTSEDCTVSGDTYTITLTDYDKYMNYDYIAFRVCSDNLANMHFQINSLGRIPIYYEYTTDYIAKGTMTSGNMYVGQIRTVDGNTVLYFLGQYQPHALCVLLSDDSIKYTKHYFEEKYNCKSVNIRIEKDNPFSVNKLGEILDEKTGSEFENIQSESVAMENALYHNRKSSTMNDTITITTKMIPWLDVHCKIEYRKNNDDAANQYIIKSISHNTENHTTSITMYRFYPLYYTD